MRFVDIISLVAGIAGLIFGIWQYKRMLSIKAVVKSFLKAIRDHSVTATDRMGRAKNDIIDDVNVPEVYKKQIEEVYHLVATLNNYLAHFERLGNLIGEMAKKERNDERR